MVPSEIPKERLEEQGLRLEKLIAYPGFKEEMYVYDFRPQPDLLSHLNLDSRKLIVTLRPPQTWAHYHNHHTDVLLEGLIQRLRREKDAQVVVLCRTVEQAETLRRKYDLGSGPFRMLTEAIDGLSLMWFSDFIFSGGGTMVREAALLGLNACSIFAGKLGAADAALERQGKLTMIRKLEEIEQFRFEKRKGTPELKRSSETRDFICEQVLNFAKQNECRKSSERPYESPAPISPLRG
jgi:uncharacterized protein